LAAAIVTIAVLGALLPRGALPQFAALAPIAYSIAVIADAATAFVLLAAWSHAPVRRSTLVLALSFGASAVVLFMAMLALPYSPRSRRSLRSSHRPASGSISFGI
jgi:hypothetical protein